MNKITLTGKIGFDPQDFTKKHLLQSSWKKIAMIFFEGEVCQYYGWFIQRRYNLILNPPLRGGHVSFINDSYRDLGVNGTKSNEEIDSDWDRLKSKWDGKDIDIVLDVNPRTDSSNWWLNIPQEDRDELHAIRAEIGLGRPHWGLHMSIGYANEKNIFHSEYIHKLIKNGFIV